MEDQVRTTLDQWLLTETQHRLADAGLQNNPPNHLCISVIPVVHTYTMAILDLIDAQFKLPAMGLLRVLAELTLTTCWCLIEPDPEVKVRRWLKQSYIERKKFLKHLVDLHGISENDRAEFSMEIGEVTRQIEAIEESPAGGLWNRIGEIPSQAGENYRGMYQLLYSPFHRGVHPDLTVLGDTLRQEGEETVSLGDFGADHMPANALIRPCVHLVYQLVAHIRTYQKWDTEQLKREYFAVLDALDTQQWAEDSAGKAAST
jgi:hypothetical protein